ncbi:MAG: serine/threonine protein kinase [Bryobacterales bacterium]|nr:serine/threonine protein kinase [Bryobacterales bacterium]
MSDTRSLFHALANLDAPARQEYYQQHQVPDSLRHEVEDLLRFDHATRDAFAQSVAAEAHQWGRAFVLPRTSQCGPYRLVRELGQGGMGSVYLAERSDGEIEQQVAIKLLRSSADAPAWLDRFLRERQILASLRHPGITQLLDAGRTADGQPYLVMEYVPGTPIDKYVEGRPVRERLDLFLQVCDAVAYAHRNLIIHRDIKPSNILVTEPGVAKLLDFGIAKILDAPTDKTRTRERFLTPEYASPEQVTGSAHSTSTDIYSLGAVLYKLLTGRSPHVIEGASPDSMEAVICRTDPTRASQVNTTLPKDLDFILAMALRKEPEARYRSVEAFMDDVHAFLDHRPVHARGADPLYRLRRTLRRYWVPVTAAALAIGGLTAGFITASRERAVAEQRFVQLRQAANRFIHLNKQLSSIPGNTKLRQSVLASSLDYLKVLESGAGSDPDLAVEVMDAYTRVADVQSVALGSAADQKRAAETLQNAIRLSDAALRRWPEDDRVLAAALILTDVRIRMAANQKRDAESLAYSDLAWDLARRIKDVASLPPVTREGFVMSLSNTALTYFNNHRPDDGIRAAQLAAKMAQGTERYGIVLSLIASGQRLRGDLEQALVTIREARHALENAGLPEVPRRYDLYAAHWREGVILGEEDAVSLGRWKEAAVSFARSMEIVEPLVKQDPADSSGRIRFASGARELGDILARREPARALAVYDQGLQRVREMAPNPKLKRDEVRLLTGSSYALTHLKRHAEARRRIDSAFKLLAEVRAWPAPKVEPGSEAFVAMRALADWEDANGNRTRAFALYQELLQKMEASGSDPKLDLQYARNYSGVYERLSALAPAAGAARFGDRRRTLWQHWAEKRPASSFVRTQLENLR